jgi:hypothetical protein
MQAETKTGRLIYVDNSVQGIITLEHEDGSTENIFLGDYPGAVGGAGWAVAIGRKVEVELVNGCLKSVRYADD